MAVAGDGLEKFEDMIVRQAEATGAQVAAAKAAIGNVIFGQDPVVEQALITVLCGGHALLIGLPGLAKTKLVETMGIVLGLDARRIQFTPDLMPSDILGSEVRRELDASRVEPEHDAHRSEEHTSELQSRLHLVCRLLLEKKNIHSIRIVPCCQTVSSIHFCLNPSYAHSLRHSNALSSRAAMSPSHVHRPAFAPRFTSLHH